MFTGRRALRFFPTASMPVHAQLNAIFRFCLYYSLIMTVLTMNARHMIIAALAGIMTVLIAEVAYKDKGASYQSGDEDKEPCRKPEVDNPYMNFQPFDERDRAHACKPWNVNEKINVAAGEPIQDSPYQRPFDRFYTMPCTTATNDQAGFAEWLYGSMPAKQSNPENPMSITNHPRHVGPLS